MTKHFKAIQVNDYIYWVGAVDGNIRDFHGYLTSRGTSYNAYLVLADRITLIDTVKAPFRDEMLSRISSVIDPGDISYFISNHAEMDHSGCLPDVIDAVNPDKVFASNMGVKALTSHFHLDHELTAVGVGETISLGNRDVTFVETRMLHWPDSMFSYLPGDGVLFSNDAFGMHLASSARFADDIDESILREEGEKYFANILLPYANLILKLLDRVRDLKLDIRMIAPDHGPIWRTKADIEKVLNHYASWAAQKRSSKVIIVFDTMWGSTEKMARVIAEGIIHSGIEARLMSLRSFHRSEVAREMLDCGALVVGSPTLNNNLFPTVADTMTYLKGLRPQNLIGAAFGSYGWSGEAVRQLQAQLAEMGVELVGEGVSTKYVPDEAALVHCFELGTQLAQRLDKR